MTAQAATMPTPIEFELRYDLRNPVRWQRPWDELYARFLEQAAWADANGFDVIDINEHHFAPDGYMPAPITMAAAVAARTKRITIRLGIIILPLKHPVQLAEELAVLDNISGGRLEVIFGAGYRPEEYAAYGIPMSQRGSRMEEGVEIIRHCWEKERFSFEGKHWQLNNVEVRPRPFQKPRPRLLLGGNSVAAARRAARLADGYVPTSEKALQPWREEMLRLGRNLAEAERHSMRKFLGAGTFVHVAEDPQADWARIRDHIFYVDRSYATWTGRAEAPERQPATPDDLLKAGGYAVMTPAAILAEARTAIAAGQLAKLRLQPMMGGLPDDVSERSLELVAREIIAKL